MTILHLPWRKPAATVGFLTLILTGNTWPAWAQPTNDNFAERASIVGTNVFVTGSLANATLEPGELSLPEVSSGQTAWWTWTAPTNGILTLSAAHPIAEPVLAVYLGGDLLNLSLVASNNYLSQYTQCGTNPVCHWKVRNQITFPVVREQTYQIAVDAPVVTTPTQHGGWSEPIGSPYFGSGLFVTWTTNVVAGGAYWMGLQFTAAPQNDAFDHPIALQGSRRQVQASNAGATREIGEPEPVGNPGGSSVWYVWRAPASGRVTLSATEIPAYAAPSSSYGSAGCTVTTTVLPPRPCSQEAPLVPLPSFFPVFSAYTGSEVSALTPAGCLPLSLPGYEHAVAFDAVKGQTYHLALDGNQGTTGKTLLCLALTQPAINNNFKHRLGLHGISVVATGYNAGASQEPCEPVPMMGSTGKTVWWTWTAPVSGTVSLDLSGSDYAFPVTVFTGASLAELSLVATNSGAITFTATAGQSYQIAVSDAAGLTGAIRMTLRAPLVELDLVRALSRSPKEALLSYAGVAGLTLLLQRSNDGSTWQGVRTVVAHGNVVTFLVGPAPSANGPFYRAIILDRSFR